MSEIISENKRIAKNTIYLYFRMIIIMAVSLLTSRVILKTLGVEDFGIYNLVGGVTAMFQFLTGTLADATQRYITFEIGKGTQGNVNKIFSQCVILHLILAVLILVIAEPIGLWFLDNKLIIPGERMYAAKWIFQLSLVSMFILIISVPYNALIVAHEKMKAFAMISVVEVFGRLVIAYALLLTENDRLILYGILIMCLQILIRFLYTVYCKKNFSESNVKYFWDRSLLKEMFKFASWTIIGNLAYICVTQGLGILLGMFFLPVVNAARGISLQVQNAVVTFVRNFQTAINPQITKSYAASNLPYTHSLIYRSSRFSFFLVLLPLLPIILETDFILNLWLTVVPDHTSIFVRVVLLISLINSLANPLAVGIKATGRIKEYELYSASLKLFVLPVAYVLLKFGASPVIVFIVYLVFEFLAFLSNIIVTSHFVKFSLSEYVRNVLIRVIGVSVLSSIIPFITYIFMPATFTRFMIVLISSVVSSSIAIYMLGLTYNERQFINSKLQLFIKKIKQ